MLYYQYKSILLISLCLLLAACGQSDSEELFEQQMLLKFKHYYLTAAADPTSKQKIKKNSLDELTVLSQQNSDALRTLAFLWQQRANLICDNTGSNQTELTELAVGYESLLNDSQQALPSIQEDEPETVACMLTFYRKNFRAIHNMLLFQSKTNGF